MAGLKPCTRPVILRAHRPETMGPGAAGPSVPAFEVAARCWTWDCAGCGPGRRVEAWKIIKSGIESARVEYGAGSVFARFVTITYPNHRDLQLTDPDDLRTAHRDLRLWVQYVRRHHGRRLEYVRVSEPTKRGRVHLHLVTTGPRPLPKCTDAGRRHRGLPTSSECEDRARPPCYCPPDRPCVQQIAWSLGMGFVHIRRLDSARKAAGYLAKYLAKGTATGHRFPRYARRLSKSNTYSPVTFGGLRSEFVAHVRSIRRLAGEPSEVPAGYVWTGPYPRGTVPFGVNPTTGEVVLPSRLR